MTRTSILLIVVGALLAAWFYLTKQNQPVPPTAANVNPKVVRIEKEKTQPVAVEAYEPAAKAATKLPKAIQEDPAKHVIESSTVLPDSNPQTVTTVLDDKTGKVETYVEREPKLWLDTTPHREIRLDYGFKAGPVRVVRMTFRDDVFQVKSFNFGFQASADSDGDFFIGVGVGYKW